MILREKYAEKSILRLYQIAGVKELKLSVIYGLRAWRGLTRGELKTARKTGYSVQNRERRNILEAAVREKEIESYLRDRIRRIGGKAYKFVSPGNNGVPDRLVCLPGGQAVFVELKAPGKAPRPIQIHQIGMLKQLGFRVEVIDSKEQVDEFVKELSENGN